MIKNEKDIGVKIKKKIKPKIIGLTILPSIIPRLNHALFAGYNKFGFKKLIKKKIKNKLKNKMEYTVEPIKKNKIDNNENIKLKE